MRFRGWERLLIECDNGRQVEGIAPVIVSASRATDIPAFYANWFLERLNKGWAAWRNPFNGHCQYISFAKTRVIVFWTKNPAPLMERLDELDSHRLNYYFQFTVNDYEAEGWEARLPPLARRLDTFRALSRRLGPERVIWRFDPLILSDTLDVSTLLSRIERIAVALDGATRKLVISFIDIERYSKVKRNLERVGAMCREIDAAEKHRIAAALATIGRRHGLTVATCAEEADLGTYGIENNRCVDDALMRRVFSSDTKLMTFLAQSPTETNMPGRHPLKDKGQRPHCGCIVGKDIGRYNTCPHLCAYCYANRSENTVLRNRSRMAGGYPAVLAAPLNE